MREFTQLRCIASKAGFASVLFAAICIGIWSGQAFAQLTSVSGSGDMLFGKVAGDADQSGTVVLNTSDQLSFAGGAHDMGGVGISGEFKLVGPNGTPYSCSLPASIQISDGANTMTVDGFTVSPGLIGVIVESNRQFLDVGATLHTAPGQPAGDYLGDLPMTCNGLSDTTRVKVSVFEPFSISTTGSLEFGTVEATGVAGTVTIAPDGTRTSTNVIEYPSTVAAASFTVTGEKNEAYAISLPASTTLTGPSATMTIDTFTHDAGVSPVLVGTSGSFNVGATLHVGASQAPGGYSGSFTVTANYN